MVAQFYVICNGVQPAVVAARRKDDAMRRKKDERRTMGTKIDRQGWGLLMGKE